MNENNQLSESLTLLAEKTLTHVFTRKFIQKHPTNTEFEWTVFWNGQFLITHTHWVMSCCGLDTLCKPNYYLSTEKDWFWNRKDCVDAFFSWLHKEKPPAPQEYHPKEYLFLLADRPSKTLINNYYKELVSHPLVKQIDSFKNKSHGPNTLYLYRLSLLGDFS